MITGDEKCLLVFKGRVLKNNLRHWPLGVGPPLIFSIFFFLNPLLIDKGEIFRWTLATARFSLRKRFKSFQLKDLRCTFSHEKLLRLIWLMQVTGRLWAWVYEWWLVNQTPLLMNKIKFFLYFFWSSYSLRMLHNMFYQGTWQPVRKC